MKKLFLFIILAGIISSCLSTRKSSSMSFAKNTVVAHRGAFKKNNLPENSVVSLREAIRLGCTGSEFDVRMSADDSLIINHDPHFNKLEIEKSTYKELTAFSLSNGEKLPTLQEYLLAGMQSNKHTRLVLEIKPSGISKDRGRLIAARVLELVKKLQASPWIVYISFDYDILKELRRLDPAVSLQYLEGNIAPAQLKADGINGADYHFSVFKTKPHWIREAKENGIALNAWTVNDSTTMNWLLKEGFDFITTNEPEMLMQLVNERISR